MAYNRKRLRLGELLLENNLITEEQLNIALEFGLFSWCSVFWGWLCF